MSVYFIQAGNGPIKIGFTDRPSGKRASEIQADNHEEISLLLCVPGDEKYEAELHHQFSAYRLRGEWFFPDQEILDFIAGNPASTHAQIVEETVIERVVRLCGGTNKLARSLGITHSAICQWKRIPEDKVRQIEILCRSRVTRYEMRPDVYGPLKVVA